MSAIKDAIADARPPAAPREPDADGFQPRNEHGPGLPDDSPVRAVGKMGTTCIFLDALHQLTFAGPRELGEAYLTDYFAGDYEYLRECWPRWGKEKITFSAEDCRRAIQHDCALKGIWDDMERVRGRGAWRADIEMKPGEDPPPPQLILHCGDVIHFPDRLADPGEHDGRVYPGGPHMMEPLKASVELPAAEDPRSAGHRVMALLSTWHWKRACDARLFLGGIIAGFVGGALTWRPSLWITSESGAGKSTLIRLRREIMDTWSLNAANATAASIYQRVKFDAIGVTLDEQENTADSRRLDDMVKLARDAASGDLILRGGAGGTGTSFRARNSFQFASINAAALRQQDLNRMPQLELGEIPDKAPEPDWTALEARRWGQEILRRLMINWPRWEITLEAHRVELKRMGHDSRGADTYGTLMALADMVLSDEGYLSADNRGSDAEFVEVWDALLPSRMDEYQDRTPEYRGCLEHLLASRPREWKTGAPASIGGAVRNCLRSCLYEDTNGDVKLRTGDNSRQELNDVNALLAYAGCRLDRHGRTGFRLFVLNRHPGLLDLYEGSDWKGIPNATGPWARAMKRAPNGIAEALKLSVDGTQGRGVAVRIEEFIDWRDRPADDAEGE